MLLTHFGPQRAFDSQSFLLILSFGWQVSLMPRGPLVPGGEGSIRCALTGAGLFCPAGKPGRGRGRPARLPLHLLPALGAPRTARLDVGTRRERREPARENHSLTTNPTSGLQTQLGACQASGALASCLRGVEASAAVGLADG